MQPPRQLKTLDDLLAQAEHYAHFCMGNSGTMAPTLFLIGPDGPLMCVPPSMTNENEKDAFAINSRLMCIACAATAAVMALEAWLKTAKPDEPFDLSEPPSEAFDRQEVVVLMGESRDGQKQKFLPIIRSDNQKFFGFGESDLNGVDSVEGRFANILPPKAHRLRSRASPSGVEDERHQHRQTRHHYPPYAIPALNHNLNDLQTKKYEDSS